jgi:hypothetical protein
MNAPVLLVVFKRPASTRRALEAIARAKPSRLFVAADGPRTADEAEACRLTRAEIDAFRDQLEIVTNFADENLGCGIRVHTAITWAFTQTEELIILEDDCLPNDSFFTFCNEMLVRYRDDERVMHISGDNFVGPEHSGECSYYFSKYTHAWGWATWRRAWKHFDWTIGRWPALRDAGLVQNWCCDPYEQRYWTEIFNQMHGGVADVWDYMWMFSCWAQSGLTILPSANLVRNDGWGPDATHTFDPFTMPPMSELDRIDHPANVLRNVNADAITFDRNFGGAQMREHDSPRARFRRRISPLLLPARLLKRAIKRILPRN